MNLEDDAAVARQVKNHQGREAVFDAAYARYKDPMMDLCWRVTGNWADGEDAFQNAMVSVYKGLGGFKGKARFSTWLYRVCLQSGLRVRSRSKRKTVDLPPDAYTPEGPNRTEQRDELERILTAMNQLPDDTRLVLHLFALKELGHAEIAELLGIPEGTVWSRLHRARKQLQQRLDR
jgi:RNA polymerase sigma-70 factor (ECF subfamily)